MDDREEPTQSLDVFTQEGPGLFAEPAERPSPTPDEPLALYRRYRPETFSQIIGQDHVTAPLKRALANNRVNHAYLFSGPRGCGKTSSARILARSLNCEKGPTPEPCGVCESCRDLARGGPGSIDVIEIDAASHGGVDDARDLRERAFFAPVHSRYKIYIVDEAHMVSPQGFNALLKLVEEPPPHVKFIFATTEPDKVIGTIRSRTHHYPFRLIPPKTMTAYLAEICAEEHVSVEAGVIPMVVRAGAGSVRDSLSILDQLFGGADESKVAYAQAASLLGYTPDSLLDSVVDALVAGDPGGVFAGIDKVIETGQDPRRFAEDLLTRLRDLVIVAAVPDTLSSGLLDIPGDQAERYKAQVNQTNVGALTRAAEILAAGLVGMRGTTTPRLQLELMCARILLPGADPGERGLLARVERIERRLTGVEAGGSAGPALGAEAGEPGGTGQARQEDREPGRVGQVDQGTARDHRETAPPRPAGPARTAAPSAPSGRPAATQLTTEDIRRSWPAILKRVSTSRRYVWMILNQYVAVTELRGTALWLTFADPGPRENFNRNNGEEQVAQAIAEELGAHLVVRARLESEPIPADGTAILSLATPPGPPQAVPATPPAPTASPAGSPAGPVGAAHNPGGPLGPTSGPAGPVGPAKSAEGPVRDLHAVPDPHEPDDETPGEPHPQPSDEAPAPRNSDASQAQNPSTAPPVNSPDTAVSGALEAGSAAAATARTDTPDTDAPSEDDEVVESDADQAEELVMELFAAELVKAEATTPARRTRKKA